MADNFSLARPYVKAIFNLALQRSELQEWENLLQVLAFAIECNSMSDWWQDPRVTLADRLQLLRQVCEVAGIPVRSDMDNFLRLLLQKKKALILPQIFALYQQERNKHDNVTPAIVVSAFALTDEQLHRIEAFIERRLQTKVTLNKSIDPELIGGVIVRAKDYVMDGSIRSYLQKMRDALI